MAIQSTFKANCVVMLLSGCSAVLSIENIFPLGTDFHGSWAQI